jgi:hypothetical protein
MVLQDKWDKMITGYEIQKGVKPTDSLVNLIADIQGSMDVLSKYVEWRSWFFMTFIVFRFGF